MLRLLLFVIVLSNQHYLYGQINEIDSITQPFRKEYIKNIKLLKNKNDSSIFLTAYNKKSHKLVGVQILIESNYINSEFRKGQYTFHFYPDNLVLIKVSTEHSQGNRFGDARYLFKSGVLIYKEEDGFIDQDYSFLYTKSDTFKNLGNRFLKKKFLE